MTCQTRLQRGGRPGAGAGLVDVGLAGAVGVGHAGAVGVGSGSDIVVGYEVVVVLVVGGCDLVAVVDEVGCCCYVAVVAVG